ncbi:MAG TPA: acyltransferase domain-containing protein, partial [Micromonosporaceae bacterium]|nr:acyltransferase domain-containing protein [Micromonosporaceae bacterium]
MAAVNGASSTVVSGPPHQVAAVVAAAETEGLRARTVDVDYASHGPQVDQIAGDLTDQLAEVGPVGGTQVAFYSTVEGRRIDTGSLDGGYWVANLRRSVRFADTIQALLTDGYRVFVEASPHPVLTVGMQETFEQAGVDAAAVATLRRDHGDRSQLAYALGQAFTAGVAVDWTAWFPADPPPRVVDLPTYAFQRQRFWLATGGRSGDAGGHGVLGHAVELADTDGVVLTGRLATATHPWLADHRVLGSAVVPGAALVEWALWAGDTVGCGGVQELVLHTPLVLPGSGDVQVQVVVDTPAAGGRGVRVYSRPDTGGGWLCHATGVLAPEASGPAQGLGGPWPPAGARPVGMDGFYQRVAAAGYEYGPAFAGVRALWRDGSDVLAEVSLPEAAGGTEGTGVHPALLDAVLHPMLLLDGPAGDGPAGDGKVWLPFAWNGVWLWATGASTVRVRLSAHQRDGERAARVVVTDPAGGLVLTADAVLMRPAGGQALQAAGGHGLYTLDWTPVPVDVAEDGTGPAGPTADERPWVVLGPHPHHADGDAGIVHLPDLPALVETLDAGSPAPDTVLAAGTLPGHTGPDAAHAALDAVGTVLTLLQHWLAEPRLAATRLVIVTRNAVPTGTDAAADLAGAAVWGLVRSAQAEHPDRFTLLDLDPDTPLTGSAVTQAVTGARHTNEAQVALRDGQLHAPRLTRTPEAEHQPVALSPDGTVLITGGTGRLAGLVAEHLVRAWQVRHLILASRTGPDAAGAVDTVARLGELGAQVRVVPVDVGDAAAVAGLVAGTDPAHPLTGVIHAAGVLDDAMVTSLSAPRLAGVWAAKATAALNLHAATAGLPLAMFVMFSSAAATLGSPGQGSYAAANAACDALAAHRRAAGLPGLSIGWGLWADASGMTGHLTEVDLARVNRSGNNLLATTEALELLDDAYQHGGPHLLAVNLDRRALAAQPAHTLPPALRGLAVAGRGPSRRTAASGPEGAGLVSRLAGLDAAARLDAVVQTVRECAAAVLGHRSTGGVRAEATFKSLGFDSLTAVELRNRLSSACGVRLPATLVFDYPTPQALAAYLDARLAGESPAAGTPAARVTGSEEPVAIVAMACRYPGGVGSPEELWRLVAGGVDAMGPFPADRGWDLDGLFHPDQDHSGTSYADQGAFLHDAARFDAGFFGISPREAVAMDPQQRLLLEVAWELLERSGIGPATLKGSRTGVYAGVMYHDYGAGTATGDTRLDGYSLLGSQGSVVSGRVAYTFGFEGPAVTVDTACSSSLVAMHLAGQALRQGECSLALAGGVTVMATPNTFVEFSRQQGLARDGRCKPFAAAADGTGWGEGVGLVLLERLSDARRNGHRVLAVVRGSAVNQDGASNGLTAPNGPSQQRVILQALANAGLSPAEVDAVEGHGTGTVLGDPIEAQALLATYGQGRPEGRPLWLGSVKSNIGHTQAAAGVAGVIKMVLAMRHGVLPPSLHIDQPSPHVDWDCGAVRLLAEAVAWPDGDRPRRAGVSSFGASGTNAHLVLEQAPEPAGLPPGQAREPAGSAGLVVPWVISGRGAEALRAQAAALATHVAADPVVSPVDVGWSLLATRSAFEHRAVVVGRDRDGLLAGVRAVATGEAHPDVVHGDTRAAGAGGTVWLLTGQGSQRVGMGAGLYTRFPVFAEAFDQACALLDPHLHHPLRQTVFHGPAQVLDHTTYAQAGLFALQVALARLLDSLGVHPDVLIGHSIGEVSAAHLAGVLDLPDACRLVAARATLMGQLPPGGAMAAIQATPAELDLDPDGPVAVAAVNTPDSTVISGPADLVAQACETWAQRGRKTRRLPVSHAFHSPLMDPILDQFHRAITGLAYHPPTIELFSNLTGQPAGHHITTPDYWAHQIRRPVQFHPAIAHTAPHASTYLELGPDPILTTATQHTLHHAEPTSGQQPTPRALSTLNANHPDDQALARTLAELHATGTPIDWTHWFPASPPPRVVDLPTYAFQRECYWLAPGSGAGDIRAAGLERVAHPFLPAAVALADGGLLLTGRLSLAGSGAWLAGHRVLDAVLVPGAVLVEWALRAADESGCAGVEELVVRAPLVLGASGGVRVQVEIAAPDADGRRELRVYSRPDRSDGPGAGAPWACHATGVLAPEAAAGGEELGAVWPPAGAVPVDAAGFYERVSAAGYGYGPAFQGLRAVWRDGEDLLAEVELPEAAGDPSGFGVHPVLLDAALHPGLLEDRGGAGLDGRVWLPFAWTGVSLWATGATMVRVRLTPHQEGAQGEHGVRVTMVDASGAPVLSVDSVVLRPAGVDQLRPVDERGADSLFTLDWTPLPVAASGTGPALPERDRDGWVVVGAHPVAPDLASYPDLGALVAAVDAGAPAPSMVLVSVPAAGAAVDSGDDLAGSGLAAVELVLGLVQGWLAEPRLVEARLVVVTRGGVVVGDGDTRVDVAGAGVWGLVRAAQSEHPGRFVLLDLDADLAAVDLLDGVAHAVGAQEWQVAVR